MTVGVYLQYTHTIMTDTWILITGCRYWQPTEQMRKLFSEEKPTLVIHGTCTGVDTVADVVATEMGIEVHREYPDWKTHGKRAGPMRNAAMIDVLQRHPGRKIVYAFHQDLSKSRGTKDCMRKAELAGLEVRLISE